MPELGLYIALAGIVAVGVLATYAPTLLANFRNPARRQHDPADGMVECHCSYPECDRYAYIDFEYLLSDNCPWQPTRCPDHRIPATQTPEGTA
jgi:hypothetical protein